MKEEYTIEQADVDIKVIIKKLYPTIEARTGHDKLGFVKKMLEYHESMSHAEMPIFWYDYDEDIEVGILQRMAKSLEYNLIEKGLRPSKITKYEPKNDFEDGVCTSIGHLHFIVHCMNPG